MLRPLWESGSMGSSVIRSKNRGRPDFWTLGNEIGRSRRYRRVVIDEASHLAAAPKYRSSRSADGAHAKRH